MKTVSQLKASLSLLPKIPTRMRTVLLSSHFPFFAGMWFFGFSLVPIKVITLKCFSVPKALGKIK